MLTLMCYLDTTQTNKKKTRTKQAVSHETVGDPPPLAWWIEKSACCNRYRWYTLCLAGYAARPVVTEFCHFSCGFTAVESLKMLLIWFASNFSFVFLLFRGSRTRRYRHPKNLIFQSSAEAEKSLLQLLLYVSSECARILGKEKGREKDGKSSRCESFQLSNSFSLIFFTATFSFRIYHSTVPRLPWSRFNAACVCTRRWDFIFFPAVNIIIWTFNVVLL